MIYIHGVYAEGFENVTWQLSESPSIQLGIRDKFGSLESYRAEFVVSGKDIGKSYTYRATKNVSGSEFAYVVFPRDFGENYAFPGNYNWKCVVNGKTVVSGKFKVKLDGLVLSR
jgi:hypothetical protein